MEIMICDKHKLCFPDLARLTPARTAGVTSSHNHVLAACRIIKDCFHGIWLNIFKCWNWISSEWVFKSDSLWIGYQKNLFGNGSIDGTCKLLTSLWWWQFAASVLLMVDRLTSERQHHHLGHHAAFLAPLTVQVQLPVHGALQNLSGCTFMANYRLAGVAITVHFNLLQYKPNGCLPPPLPKMLNKHSPNQIKMSTTWTCKTWFPIMLYVKHAHSAIGFVWGGFFMRIKSPICWRSMDMYYLFV